jgi:hypothetical protein
MVAPGAIECAHSTSRVVSAFHPNALAGSVGDGVPSGWMMFSVALGKPKYPLNKPRSCTIVLLP